MPTMKDVAKEANVSLGTVSNVLNNRSSVSLENREKVMRAVQKLNYRPNSIARYLKTNTTKSIGLVIPDITNPYYPELFRGVEDVAKKNMYTVLLCNTDRNQDKEREYLQILMDKKMDGIILVKPKLCMKEITEVSKNCALVLVDPDNDFRTDVDSIYLDMEGSIMEALQLLYMYNHRRIAYIEGLRDSQSCRTRKNLYMKFLREQGLPHDKDLIVKGDFTWISGYNCAMKLLNSKHPPTAIIASNDLMALGAIKAINERQLQIPSDISVLGFDDIDMASISTPPLTTIRHPKYEMGTLSVETLLHRINSGNDYTVEPKRTLMMKTDIIVRKSVGYSNPK
ncbi:MAG: LacI family DNA-binding transcriptional regulator [Acetivibrionales bacterium]|jgi:DNA-binding LacI/PurR family transcriptional regulator